MKMKTHQATVKRFKITRTGKVLKRKSGQGHFNAREEGTVSMMKRRDVTQNPTIGRNIKKVLPYA